MASKIHPHYNTKNAARASLEQLAHYIGLLGRDTHRPWTILKAYPSAGGSPRVCALYRSQSVYPLQQVKDAGGEVLRHSDGTACYRFQGNSRSAAEALADLTAEDFEAFAVPAYIPLDPTSEANSIGQNAVAQLPVAFAEMDSGSLDEQWRRVGRLRELTGLEPSAVLWSGGKSLHAYFALQAPLQSFERWRRLQRMLAVLLDGDPALTNPNREMRLPGVPRPSKGSQQRIEQAKDHTYSADALEAALAGSGWGFNCSGDSCRT